jgi:diguanylate cyclase (GGDEF)-like protein
VPVEIRTESEQGLVARLGDVIWSLPAYEVGDVQDTARIFGDAPGLRRSGLARPGRQPGEVTMPDLRRDASENLHRLRSVDARLWLLVLGQVAVAIAACTLASAMAPVSLDTGLAVTLVLCTVAATISTVTVVRGFGSEVYSLATVFEVAGALVLPSIAIAPFVAVPVLVDAVRRRVGWRSGLSNWSNLTLALLAGHGAGQSLIGLEPLGLGAGAVAGVVLAAVVFVGVNLGLITVAQAVEESGSWRALPMSTWCLELVLAATGGTLALQYLQAPLTALLALSPLFLLRTLLRVPMLEREARVDVKTGLFNMRHFAERLGEELARAARQGHPLGLVAADIDHFRDINNAYGHLVGDEMLALVAGVIRDATRRGDIAARFGGEEFFIALPDTGPAEAMAIAERIRSRVEAASTAAGVPMSISLGIASSSADTRDATELLTAVDAALYAAKRAGRNRTSAYQPA